MKTEYQVYIRYRIKTLMPTFRRLIRDFRFGHCTQWVKTSLLTMAFNDNRSITFLGVRLAFLSMNRYSVTQIILLTSI